MFNCFHAGSPTQPPHSDARAEKAPYVMTPGAEDIGQRPCPYANKISLDEATLCVLAVLKLILALMSSSASRIW